MATALIRKSVLLLHILASVGLFGTVATFVALAIAGLSSADDSTVRAAYWAGGLITLWLILPLGFAALATGILSGLASPWGLLRHYWVVVKLVLTLLILAALILHAFPIANLAELAASDGFGADGMVAHRRQLLMASGAGLLAILVVCVLSVFKPSGLTRHGWRKQCEAQNRDATGR